MDWLAGESLFGTATSDAVSQACTCGSNSAQATATRDRATVARAAALMLNLGLYAGLRHSRSAYETVNSGLHR